MATRNILDYSGNIIGTLTLSDDTSEADWQAALSPYASLPVEEKIEVLDTLIVKATLATTTSSITPTTVDSMTLTLEKGTYLAFFSGNIYTSGTNAQGEFGIYINGVLVDDTRRDISCNLVLGGGLVSISLNTIGIGTHTGTEITVSGGDIVDVRFNSTNGQTIGFLERNLILVEVENE